MSQLTLDERFVFRQIEVSDTDQLFDLLGGALRDAGFAADSYPQALKDRERTFPTGLPVPGGVAIPHADAEHVLRDTIGVATLARPVTFGEMGGAEEATVEVSTVFLLAFTAGERHLEILAEMIGCIQDGSFIDALHEASSDDQLVAALAAKLGR